MEKKATANFGEEEKKISARWKSAAENEKKSQDKEIILDVKPTINESQITTPKEMWEEEWPNENVTW